MQKVNFGLSNLLLFLAETVIGIMLLVNSTDTAIPVLICICAVIILLGIKKTIDYFKMYADEAVEKKALAGGLLLMSEGALCIFISLVFSVAFPFYIFIVFIIGTYRLQTAIDMIRVKQRAWQLSLFCALVALALPLASLLTLSIFPFWMFMSIYILVEALFDIVTFIVILKT